MTRKVDTYGKGKSYNLFAGKDASRALGMSSLKPEDAVSDYSTLSPGDLKTLDDWFDFFSYVSLFRMSHVYFLRGAHLLHTATHPSTGNGTTSLARSLTSPLHNHQLPRNLHLLLFEQDLSRRLGYWSSCSKYLYSAIDRHDLRHMWSPVARCLVHTGLLSQTFNASSFPRTRQRDPRGPSLHRYLNSFRSIPRPIADHVS